LEEAVTIADAVTAGETTTVMVLDVAVLFVGQSTTLASKELRIQ
jgi:hypothetical protein